MDTQILKNALLYQLCRHFRLDFDDISPIERIELEYIHSRLSRWLKTDELPIILAEIDRIVSTRPIRGKRKRLYFVYNYCNAKSIKESGRYDTTTLKPPTIPATGNYY